MDNLKECSFNWLIRFLSFTSEFLDFRDSFASTLIRKSLQHFGGSWRKAEGERADANLDLLMPLWWRLASAGEEKNGGPVGARRCQQPHGFEARKWDIDEGEESEKDVFQGQGGRRRKSGRGGRETRDEEAQQLNIPQSVVNSEWGRKTMSPLILRAHSLLFPRQVQPQLGEERETEREKKGTNQDVPCSANQVKFENKISNSSLSEFPPSCTLGLAVLTWLQGSSGMLLLLRRKEAERCVRRGDVGGGGG